MKTCNVRIISLVALVLIASICCVGCKQSPPPPPDSAQGATVNDATSAPYVKKYKEVTLDNGITVLFEEDNEVPLVSAKLYLRGGALWDRASELGVTEVTGGMMRSGGAGDRDARALDEYLTALSASVDSSWGDEFGVMSFSSLSSDVKAVFPVFADVVLKPRFEEERLQLWKKAALDSIQRRSDDPDTIASITYQMLLYGDTVYGRTLTSSSVAAITREDLVKKHAALINFQDALMVVSGKITLEEITELTQRYFAHPPRYQRSLPPPPSVPSEPPSQIYFIKGPFTQSTVMMGQLGIKRLPPDRAQIEVFNEIFGTRGFGSRLMTKIRTERGLAYGVYGSISPGIVRGTNTISLQTKSASVVEAIYESIGALEDIQQHPPLSEEVDSVKRALKNSFVFKFDAPMQRVEREAILRLLQYPSDYDMQYLPLIQGVQPAQVSQVASAYWNPRAFVVVIVGDDAALSAVKEAVAKGSLSQYFKGVKELTFNEIPQGA